MNLSNTNTLSHKLLIVVLLALITVFAKESARSEMLEFEQHAAPLTWVFDICRDTACRAILSSVRSSMKMFVSDISCPKGSCRLVMSKQLKPGYRLYYWIGVPFVTDRMIECALACLFPFLYPKRLLR